MKTKFHHIELFLQEHGGLYSELDQALQPKDRYYISVEVGSKSLKTSVNRSIYLKAVARYAEEVVGEFLSEHNILDVEHPLQDLHSTFTYIDFLEGPAAVTDSETNELLDEEAAIVFFLEAALQELINLQ